MDPVTLTTAQGLNLFGMLASVLWYALRIAFEAGEVAGALVSQGMGLASATLANPTSGEASPVVAQWFFLSFGLVFFASDGHLALVQLLFDSYTAMPVGAPIHDWAGFVASVPEFFGVALRTGVLLALPVTMALLAVNVAVGVLSKAAQQLSPMSLGFPIALLLGLLLLMALARELQGPVQRLFGQAFEAARALTG
jgi:flagellar biosynthetic protein FliR